MSDEAGFISSAGVDASAPAVSVRHLRKEYGDTVALENLDLVIPRGEVFGLIGPNGAGKTTLIRILSTLLEPTYGEAFVCGVDVLRDPLAVHPKIGYMSDFFSLYETMLVWEYLDHFARCYGVSRERSESLIGEVLELVGLEVRRDAEIRSLSRGMRQRICFAKSLMHEPELLLLDEPASGLDPAGRIEFRELIKNLHQMGKTVVVSSHILTEMADYATSIAILEEGKLVKQGRVDDILRELQADVTLLIEPASDADRLQSLLQQDERVVGLSHANGAVSCSWSGGKDSLPDLHRRLVEANVPLISFAVKTENLEDLYMKLSTHRVS